MYLREDGYRKKSIYLLFNDFIIFMLYRDLLLYSNLKWNENRMNALIRTKRRDILGFAIHRIVSIVRLLTQLYSELFRVPDCPLS